MKLSKSAQVKFGETFAILIVVYFAFVFGAQFYISGLEKSFEESRIKTQDTQALERLDLVLNYPLFLHSKSNSKELTFNELNIEAFSNLDNLTKNSIFKDSEIIIELYDISFNEVEQKIEFTPSTNSITLHNNTQKFFKNSKFTGKRIIPHTSVINVYNPKDDSTKLGILRVKNYY